MRGLTVVLVAGLTWSPLTALADGPPKVKRPQLELRASPRFSFSPASITVTAELKGGDEDETYNCPELLWEWDDGGKSSTESDCAPLGADGKIERRYTADHVFRRAGVYSVKLTMRRANRVLASQTVKVTVRAGISDPSVTEPENDN
jgi:PKD repeat protein